MSDLNLKFTHINGDIALSFGAVCESEGDFKIDANLQKTHGGYVFYRKIKNISDKTVKLFGQAAFLKGLSFCATPIDDYYYCNENGRLFDVQTLPIDYDRTGKNAQKNKELGVVVDTRYADPGVISEKILTSNYQPFPAILISNYGVKSGLVLGSLSQACFYHNYELSHENGLITVKINSDFKDIDYRLVKSGEELEDILYIGSIDNADDFNNIFEGYVCVLRTFLKKECDNNPNRHSLLWDSWNDGIFRDVSEDMLLNEAKSIKRLLPCVEWFQVDDGYSAYCVDDVDADAHGIGAYYEENHGIDLKKFPGGLKGYTEKLKKIGFKPAIWVGGWCPNNAKIYKDNPDWFIDYSHRFTNPSVLDVSLPSVREYMKNAINWFAEQGFEGIKHDFWTYAFEDSHALLANKDKSGYEYRTEWQKIIRAAVGEHGYIETGCDLSMGNPFLGAYFNNYRFGIDIAGGKWSNILTTFYWGMFVLSTHTGDLYIPNCDSIGFLRNLNDVDYMFTVNFAIISRSFVETGGRFSSVDENDPRLQILRRATKYLNNGENVYFAKYDYRRREKSLADIWYLKSHFDSPEQNEKFRTVALFNPTEQPLKIEFSAADIELCEGAYSFLNYWSGEKLCANGLSVTLAPHESRLYLVSPED